MIAAAAGPILELDNVTKVFGGLSANSGVTASVERGSITGLIGPNGAGKTTLFNCICGVSPPTIGRVIFDGVELRNMRPELISRLGISRTFQISRVLGDMSVLENVMIGAFLRYRRSNVAQQKAMDVLEFVGLVDNRSAPAKTLTAGSQKRLEVARALATEPKLLMLDEAMSGLTPAETALAVALIVSIRERGITVLLVEHVMEVVMPISDAVLVMDHGTLIASGAPQTISKDPAVIEAYLGSGYGTPD